MEVREKTNDELKEDQLCNCIIELINEGDRIEFIVKNPELFKIKVE